jgi:hypothetical protein
MDSSLLSFTGSVREYRNCLDSEILGLSSKLNDLFNELTTALLSVISRKSLINVCPR